MEKIGEIVLIEANKIDPNPMRSRSYYNNEELTELTMSISENGLIEPLLISCYGDDKYQIISGERRYKASKAAGLEEIPCIILSKDITGAAVYSLINNQQQKNLNYFEEADAIDKLYNNEAYTIKELAEKLSKPESYIIGKLRYLSIPPDMRKSMIENGITENYAKLILKLRGDKKKRKLLEGIINNRWTLAQAEEEQKKIEKGNNGKLVSFFKDSTVFTNTIDKAIETLGQSGLNAESEKEETENYIRYSIYIKKK